MLQILYYTLLGVAILFIIAIGSLAIWAVNKKKNNKPTGDNLQTTHENHTEEHSDHGHGDTKTKNKDTSTTKWIKVGIYIILYPIFVFIIYKLAPPFWYAWISSFWFFLFSNLFIIAGIILLAVFEKKKFGTWVIVIGILCVLIFGLKVMFSGDKIPKKNGPPNIVKNGAVKPLQDSTTVLLTRNFPFNEERRQHIVLNTGWTCSAGMGEVVIIDPTGVTIPEYSYSIANNHIGGDHTFIALGQTASVNVTNLWYKEKSKP